jgi:hypothetical protein
MTPPKKCIATKAWLLLALLGAAATACAAPPAGTVTTLDGRLLAKSASGTIRVLSLDSPMQQGDLLATKKDTYARVNLADGSSVILQPDTFLRVEQYVFDAANPQRNVAVLNLSKGGVRIAAGKMGRPGGGSFTLVTPQGKIEVEGATFIVQYVPPPQTEIARRSAPILLALNDSATLSDAIPFTLPANAWQPVQLAQNVAVPDSAGRSPGLYVQVLDGAIHLTNGGGTQNFTAGQFGFTPSFVTPPVILPQNPGIQFTPPPSFSSTTGSAGGTGAAKPGDVDCQVR